MAAEAAHLAEHFHDRETQAHASRLGMWIFLGTEVLLFAGLFVGYAYYRFQFGPAWAEASRHLDTTLGTVETVDLITSSMFAAMSLHFAHKKKHGLATLMLAITILMGLAFLGLHAKEYLDEFREGALPGRYYHLTDGAAPPLRGMSMFFSLYFLTTGLHGLHVTIGCVVLAYCAVRAGKGHFSAEYDTPLENGALYWHLVDLIWIFVYPLYYLV